MTPTAMSPGRGLAGANAEGGEARVGQPRRSGGRTERRSEEDEEDEEEEEGEVAGVRKVLLLAADL